jgi:hypothetical protein
LRPDDGNGSQIKNKVSFLKLDVLRRKAAELASSFDAVMDFPPSG